MAASKAPRTITAFKRFKFNLEGYNRYGLLRDDALFVDADVAKALKRIPQEERDARNFRMLRAFQCSLTHTILPKDQWTKIEDDKPYLQPYVDEVKKEREEIEDWERNH